MLLLIDFIAIGCFVAIYLITKDPIQSTLWFIVISAIQLVVTYLIKKKVEKMQLIVFFTVLFFGGATVILQDENYIKYKPTVINSIFAIVFWLSNYFIKKEPLVKTLLGKQIVMEIQYWQNLNWMWIFFFIFSALLNIFIASFSFDFWIKFKFIGFFTITLLFVVLQGIYIYKNSNLKENSLKNK